MMDERLAKVHFWLTFIGFHTTFLIQHWLGNRGMPRRYADYQASDGFTTWNIISTIGAFVLGISFLPFAYNMWRSYRFGRLVQIEDPWGHGNSLEWATSCPPPLRNFHRIPRIRSERPAFDAKFPEHAPGHSPKNPPPGGARPLSAESTGGASYQENTADNTGGKPAS
jgi:cytochrome c oxidase subunit 1